MRFIIISAAPFFAFIWLALGGWAYVLNTSARNAGIKSYDRTFRGEPFQHANYRLACLTGSLVGGGVQFAITRRRLARRSR